MSEMEVSQEVQVEQKPKRGRPKKQTKKEEVVIEQAPIETQPEPTSQEPKQPEPTPQEPTPQEPTPTEDEPMPDASLTPKTPRAKAKKASKPRVRRKVDVTVEEVQLGVEKVQQEEAASLPFNAQVASELLATHMANHRALTRQMKASKYRSMIQGHI